MRKRLLTLFSVLLAFSIIFVGCAKKDNQEKQDNKSADKKTHIVTTTTMLKDLIEKIGGDKVEVEGLMGEGVDPHLYQATASDVDKLKKADVVVYQGLHLEGKMGEVFSELKGKQVTVWPFDQQYRIILRETVFTGKMASIVLKL